MKVLHVITGLDAGGAERMLMRLILSKPQNISETIVVSLTTLGLIGRELQAHGVQVKTLELSSILSVPLALWRLTKIMNSFSPLIVQTWLYHADFFGGFSAKLAGISPVIWNIRSTAIPQGAFSMTYWLIRLCGISSYFIPDRIICCANSAKKAHIKLRYAPHKMIVIPNGYNFSAFEFNLNLRAKARLKLGFANCDIVIGVVGRFDPLKDFKNFVTAASYIAPKCIDVKFLMVGRDNQTSNIILYGWIEEAGLVSKFKLVGEQPDVAFYLSAMDIFCLSSANEAFPNVVVEAMAMGLPCVVTRAGDAVDILGDDNFVVPVRDSASLSEALLRMCRLDPFDRQILGERNAKKVRKEYGIESIRRRYDEVYEGLSRK
jgi:glycosyltransferase involved in cell wall biosynthesis